MYFTLLIIVSFATASLILASLFIHIPEWSTVLGSIIILLLLTAILLKENNHRTRVISILLSVLSIAWGVYSSFIFPYWNSETLRDISGRNYQSTLNQQARIPSDQAKSDILFCRQKISRIHPLCINGLNNTLDSCFNEALNAVNRKDSISVNELYLLMQKAVASLKDAHTRVYAINNSLRLANYSDCEEILEFDNMPFDSLVKEKLPLISYESDDWAANQIDRRLRNVDGIQSLGFSLDKGISVMYRSEGIVQEALFTESDFKQKQSVTYSMNADRIGGYTLLDSINTAYLKLDNCYYYKLRSIHRFSKGMRTMFSEIKDRGIANLILDLRDNPGGNQAISFEFFKYLPIKEYNCGRIQMRRGPFVIHSNGIRKNRINKKLCFPGNIYVLTSLNTFSAAVIFADMLQGNNLAIVIGETPGNAATSHTNIIHFVLPNSRLSLDVSTLLRNKVSDSDISIFTSPDIQCMSLEGYNKALDIIARSNEGGGVS